MNPHREQKQTLPFDVEAVRRDFPILRREHHRGVPLVYLDNAASSQKPVQVIDAVSEYYRQHHANVHRGIHKLSEEATVAYEEARNRVRRFINARSRREIVFTRGTTESINLVAQTWGRANLREGDVVLLTVMEHHSNIVPWQILAAEKGFQIRYVSAQDDGMLDMDEYARLLRDMNVRLVAVTHSSNVLGTMNPIALMSGMAHEAGAIIVIDGAQSAPHLPIDVQSLDIDFFVFSGHKMLGPTGVGVLYGKRELLEEMPPWMGGGEMISRVTLEGSDWNELPHKFEAGTPNIAQAIGLGRAIDYLVAIGMDRVHQYEQQIIAYALERLAEVPGVELYGPDASQKGAVAAFSVDNIHAHDVAQLLDSEGIAVRAGHHCAMPLHKILNVSATARASFYLYNTLSEVDQLIDGLYRVKRTFAM